MRASFCRSTSTRARSPGGGSSQRLRNFRPDPHSYLAALGGPLPYMTRLRAIHVQTAEHERQLAAAWRERPPTRGERGRLRGGLAPGGGGLELLRGQRSDRAAQPLVPSGVAAADGSADWRLRARQRRRTTAARCSMRTGCCSASRLVCRTPQRPEPQRREQCRHTGRRAARGRERCRRTSAARAPPSDGPVRFPSAQAEFMIPKPSPWASPASSARSETSAIPGV